MIVETARGVEIRRGRAQRTCNCLRQLPRRDQPVIRMADSVDVRRMRQNREDEKPPTNCAKSASPPISCR